LISQSAYPALQFETSSEAFSAVWARIETRQAKPRQNIKAVSITFVVIAIPLLKSSPFAGDKNPI
jgi:hypothetical protein